MNWTAWNSVCAKALNVNPSIVPYIARASTTTSTCHRLPWIGMSSTQRENPSASALCTVARTRKASA